MPAARAHATPPSPSLYRQLLGTDFDRLPRSLQKIHARQGRHRYHGKVEVERGAGPFSQLCGWATRLPRAGHGTLRVEIAGAGAREQWTRVIAGHALRSRLWACDGLLCERIGLVTFGFRLSVEQVAGPGSSVVWRVARVRALGVPLPVGWFDHVHAREYERDGRYRFDVAAALPRIGLLVHYRGWLHVD